MIGLRILIRTFALKFSKIKFFQLCSHRSSISALFIPRILRSHRHSSDEKYFQQKSSLLLPCKLSISISSCCRELFWCLLKFFLSFLCSTGYFPLLYTRVNYNNLLGLKIAFSLYFVQSGSNKLRKFSDDFKKVKINEIYSFHKIRLIRFSWSFE